MLDVVELGVQAAGSNQFVVGAVLSQLSVFNDKNSVGVENRGQVVRDDDRCLVLHQTLEGFEYGLFGLRVQSGRGLIQNKNRRIADHCTRDRDPLALAPGKSDAAFADHCVVAFRHFHNELVGIGQFGSSDNFGTRGFRASISDVLPDRRVEQD